MKNQIENEHLIAAIKGFINMGATFDEVMEATELKEWQLLWLVYQLQRIAVAA